MTRRINYAGVADVRRVTQAQITALGLTDPGADLVWSKANGYELDVSDDVAVFLLAADGTFVDDAGLTLAQVIALMSRAGGLVPGAYDDWQVDAVFNNVCPTGFEAMDVLSILTVPVPTPQPIWISVEGGISITAPGTVANGHVGVGICSGSAATPIILAKNCRELFDVRDTTQRPTGSHFNFGYLIPAGNAVAEWSLQACIRANATEAKLVGTTLQVAVFKAEWR